MASRHAVDVSSPGKNAAASGSPSKSPTGGGSKSVEEILAEKRAEFEASQSSATNDEATSEYPANATVCTKCNTKAVIVLDGCATCLSCGDSKCS